MTDKYTFQPSYTSTSIFGTTNPSSFSISGNTTSGNVLLTNGTSNSATSSSNLALAGTLAVTGSTTLGSINATNITASGNMSVAGKLTACVPYQTITLSATPYAVTTPNNYYLVTSSSASYSITLPTASSTSDGAFFTFRVPSSQSGATINGVSVIAGTTITFINIANTWTQF